MEIHQVLVSASPGDAVTNNALAIRDLLRRVGPSEIYARHFDPRLAGDVLTLDEYTDRRRSRPARDVLLYHASIGEPEVFNFVVERPERLVLLYHNISPAEPFLPYDPAFSGLLIAGRHELGLLRDRTELALADSSYNAAELVELGYRDVRVSPLIADAAALLDVEPDAGTTNHLETVVEGPVILFVGQLLPHKRPDLLVKAFHVLSTYLVPEANLVLVGPQRIARYRTSLQALVSELNLVRAWIAGPVTDEQLVAFYRRADVFVTASEHEGFCVPLLEAMAFDVPIVARAHAAIPETLGDAGLLLPPDSGAALLAEAMAYALEDEPLRKTLVEAGHRRLPTFCPDRSAETFLSHLASVL